MAAQKKRQNDAAQIEHNPPILVLAKYQQQHDTKAANDYHGIKGQDTKAYYGSHDRQHYRAKKNGHGKLPIRDLLISCHMTSF